MISIVDDALREIVRTQAVDGSDVDVVFDAPTKDWAARRNAPTVNIYLYDIREDLRRRERGLDRGTRTRRHRRARVGRRRATSSSRTW